MIKYGLGERSLRNVVGSLTQEAGIIEGLKTVQDSGVGEGGGQDEGLSAVLGRGRTVKDWLVVWVCGPHMRRGAELAKGGPTGDRTTFLGHRARIPGLRKLGGYKESVASSPKTSTHMNSLRRHSRVHEMSLLSPPSAVLHIFPS